MLLAKTPEIRKRFLTISLGKATRESQSNFENL